jgi:hypothetical protein
MAGARGCWLLSLVATGAVSPGATEHGERCEERLLSADRRARQVEELVWVFALDDREFEHARRPPAPLRALDPAGLEAELDRVELRQLC